jgi:hypothetical protein
MNAYPRIVVTDTILTVLFSLAGVAWTCVVLWVLSVAAKVM